MCTTASARRIGLAPLSGKTTAKTEWSEAGALKAKSSNFWSLDMTADIEKEGFNPSARKAESALEDGPSRHSSETWLRNERCLLSHHFLHDFRAAVRSYASIRNKPYPESQSVEGIGSIAGSYRIHADDRGAHSSLGDRLNFLDYRRTALRQAVYLTLKRRQIPWK